MASKSARLARHVTILRIAFGLMWAVDATFKWRPGFAKGFIDQVTSAAQGQPGWIHPWFNFWTHLLGHDPHLFATMTAVVESLIAIALVFGIARRATYLLAAIFSLLIWSIAEGFGGPYTSSSTDIGTAIIYAVVFFALYGLERLATPAYLALDNYIVARLPWWSVLANP
ncbi:MAG TPA: hypothetical protein VGS28_02980 [Candidatus Saccharimonadales bacterium]|nr:hypothetical protein [Candidatus Saccharimonadales bacterium]